nr:3-hydroxyacyl-CoA dehydrogenase NAD-binding domain-containing protein [Paraburkholderia diazotrophica]
MPQAPIVDSITALSRYLRVRQRLIGIHFFNPVPVIKRCIAS